MREEGRVEYAPKGISPKESKFHTCDEGKVGRVEESRSMLRGLPENSDLAARTLKLKRAEDFLRYQG